MAIHSTCESARLALWCYFARATCFIECLLKLLSHRTILQLPACVLVLDVQVAVLDSPSNRRLLRSLGTRLTNRRLLQAYRTIPASIYSFRVTFSAAVTPAQASEIMTALQTARKGGPTGPGSTLPPGGVIVPPNGPMLPPGMKPPGLPGVPGANAANATAGGLVVPPGLNRPPGLPGLPGANATAGNGTGV
jgi:hypothetical protein